ncbi:hypothetical protein Tco_1139315, partial [Tanacetum coccineum]
MILEKSGTSSKPSVSSLPWPALDHEFPSITLTPDRPLVQYHLLYQSVTPSFQPRGVALPCQNTSCSSSLGGIIYRGGH